MKSHSVTLLWAYLSQWQVKKRIEKKKQDQENEQSLFYNYGLFEEIPPPQVSLTIQMPHLVFFPTFIHFSLLQCKILE